MATARQHIPKRSLGDLLPRNGFRFNYDTQGRKLCARRSYDKAITNALSIVVRLVKDDVEPRLTKIFVDAAAIAAEHECDFLAMIEPLQQRQDWTARLPQAVMVELVRELFEGRARWHAHKRPPFDVGQHGALAKGIDALAEIVGASWTVGVEDLYHLAGGYLDQGPGDDSSDDKAGGADARNTDGQTKQCR
ncbi:hypothetical protein MCOR27_007907 [Pyricularia oryzae]|uniref:Uncharacterized protein n=2 Tax=Pyricularia TaxID=48558 RepID=A0ABQ8P2C6_PYRGI|nr:hypothetical protein MCOR01_001402 [Pyricularia oryzae]KAI6304265.1 hypothetical protein MCOR33_000780 [Pyricularia grisea]KAH9430053.1 hypothetical protein MCOR02_009775 [Pyricularia oryzae]KAI6257035.1 hypothetical protein MCOR19_006544 [Pyricularia oryzae]KAI6273311.1 hypothetical protein MCOR27_007907 [Pyricularia oryzae]